MISRTFVNILVLALAVSVAGCAPSASDAMRQGQSFLEKGELAPAVIAFRNAVQADPGALEARVALGDALERSGDLTGAEQQYRRALELGGDANSLVPKIAVILMDRSDLLTLVRNFGEKQLPLPPANSDLRGILAVAHLTLGEKPRALEDLSRATVLTPAVRLARAQLALGEGRNQDATAELEHVLTEGNPPWWVLRATSRVYWAKGDGEKALVAMKGAYDAVGSHPDVMGEYAEKLFRSGNTADAMQVLDRMKKIAPNHYRTSVLDALAQMENGKFEEAYTSATRVLAALPDHLPSQLIAAKVELNRGELSSAELRLQKILGQNPQLLEALRMRFMLELRQGNVKSASQTLKDALRTSPKDAGLLTAAADLAWAKGDKAGALKQMAVAAQAQPVQPRLLARLAEMKFALGKVDEAKADIDQAIALSTQLPQSREDVLRATLHMRFLDKAKAMAQADVARRPKDPEPHMWLAGVLGSEGNADGAFEQTRLALDTRADYYPALFALAKMVTSPERAKIYDDRLQKALQSGSKDARIYLDQVRRLELSGTAPEQVLAVFEQGLKADPASAELREAAVRHWLALGRKDRALMLATEGEAAQPESVAMIALAASTNEATGNLELAVKKYAQLSARFPDRIDWTLVYAQSLVHAGRSSEAIMSLRKLIVSRPDEPAPYRLLAMLQMDEKQNENALLTARMLRDRPKLRASGLLLLGDIYARSGDKNEALKAYAELSQTGAVDVARVRKIELLDRLELQTFANGELQEWLSKNPNSIAALSLAARRESAKQNHASAARYLESVVQLEPRNPIALNDLAWAYAQSRNPAALPTAQKALELAPQNAMILDTLAEAQIRAGQRKEAAQSLRRALAIAPGQTSVRIHLADLLVSDGHKNEAAELFQALDERTLDKETVARLQSIKKRL